MKLLNMAEKCFVRAGSLLACQQHGKLLTGISIDSSMFNNVFMTMVFPEQLGLLSFGATPAKARKGIFHPPSPFFVCELENDVNFLILLMKGHGNHLKNGRGREQKWRTGRKHDL